MDFSTPTTISPANLASARYSFYATILILIALFLMIVAEIVSRPTKIYCLWLCYIILLIALILWGYSLFLSPDSWTWVWILLIIFFIVITFYSMYQLYMGTHKMLIS